MQQIPQQTTQQAKQAARQASPWLVWLGRFGYAAKGVVYGLVGVLALLAALGRGGQTTDTRGVLQTIVDAPFGRVLLAVVALGLFGHAVWRFVQAAFDTENKGTDAQGSAARVAYAAIGVIYVGLALAAARLVLGTGGGNQSSDQSAQDWTARLLQQPPGRWLVGLAGLIVIGIGAYQFYRAYKAEFREKLKLHEMSAAEQTWTVRIGRFGFAARGVVFAIIGSFLIVAALQEQAEQARGLGGALDTLAGQSSGSLLLGVVALGLVAYGVFMLVQARYRRMVIT